MAADISRNLMVGEQWVSTSSVHTAHGPLASLQDTCAADKAIVDYPRSGSSKEIR